MANPFDLMDLLRTFGESTLPKVSPEEKARLTRTSQGVKGQEVLEALIPTPKNLPLFLQRMQGTFASTGRHLPKELREAEAFLRVRYPSMFKKSVVFEDRSIAGTGQALARGDGPSRTNLITVGKPAAWGNKVHDYINILAHEALHGAQDRHKTIEQLTNSSTYITPPDSLLNLIRAARYRFQPVERSAYRAGRTAVNSYKDFINLVSK